ncbi:MAG: dienelactone hydrolase family protein [Gammaproteobacteria bacterium]|nr:dienelactone hydrolase family protein [Gammaproteobacteria bacterium]MCW8986824.1 dienelactone hydrolase family protein [Gammaproteobacteria bacterium]
MRQKRSLFSFLLITVVAFLPQFVSAHEEAQDNSWWWDKAWWDEGKLSPAKSYDVEESWSSYTSNGVDVPVMVVRPRKKGKFPAVFFQHGRRGLDDLIQRHARRIAAQGFVVLAPDIYKAHFIGTHPVEHDYELEKDVNNGLDVLLARKDISSKKACLYSHTRGGYYTLKVATTFGRQNKEVACYVSYYPHLQDPNAPEPSQVYGYAPEVDKINIPMLVFIGDEEQYQRRRVIETGINQLRKQGKDARVIVYPGVGRGFDFRPENVRTFADDLAAKDAVQRAAAFMNKHLNK